MSWQKNEVQSFAIDFLLASFSAALPKTIYAPIDYLKLRITFMDYLN